MSALPIWAPCWPRSISCRLPRRTWPKRKLAESPMDNGDTGQRDVQQLREEHAMLGELLRIERVSLANYMAYAARTLARTRSQLQRRAREPEQFQNKLARL